ncbi:MAG: YbbR-like domain-containing protein [Deltaproteobacteria bacterium]|nr:YbbR-like domain-containing protein [Deltaproteobacteria bacterium]
MPSERPETRPVRHSSEYRKWVLLTCLLLAGALLYWSVSCFYEGRIVVRVALKNIPSYLMVTGRPNPAIEIRVRGPESVIKKLNAMDLVYTMDVSGGKAGPNRIRFARNRFPLPDGIVIEEIYGHETVVHLEKSEIKTLPVHPVLTGKPAFGYAAGTVTAKPGNVTLKGPEKIMEKLAGVNGSIVDITGLSEPVTRTISLELPENVLVISPDPPFLAYIDIHKKIIEKKFRNLTVYGKNCPYDFVIRPEKVEITISGPLLSLAGKGLEKAMHVYVDMEGLKPGIYVKPATIRLPEGVSLAVADPKLFTVEIRAPEKKERK